jgi:type I restriction enzyme S subunit
MFRDSPKKSLLQLSILTMGQSPVSSSYNDNKNGLPFYQGKTEFGEKYITTKMYCTDPKKKANAGDVLISVRAPVGAVNMTLNDCCIGRGLASIRGRQGKIHSEYIFYALRTIEDEISAMGQGATFKAINKDHLYNNVMIPEATVDEQDLFISFVQKTDKSKTELQKSLDNLNAMTKALIQENLK